MLSIGTFSKISNVTTKALRYYDEIGLLKPVDVNLETGYRYYSVDQLETILLISRLKAYQLSLDEIAKVLHDEEALFPLLKSKQRCLKSQLEQMDYLYQQLEEDLSNLERGNTIMSNLDNIDVKLVEEKPKNILFIRNRINIQEEYGKYMGKLMERIAKDHLTITGAPMTIFHDEQYNPEDYDCEIAIPIEEVVTGTRDLPGSLCATYRLHGPYTKLPSVYAKLVEWIEKEGYTLANAPYEVYLTNPAEVPPEEFVTEIFFPIKK